MSDIIFTINRTSSTIEASSASTSDDTVTDERNEQQENNNEEVEEQDEVKIMCIIWRNGKMAAAYYNISTKILYCYKETIDPGPEFVQTRLIFNELSPKLVLTFGSETDDYVKALSKLCEGKVPNPNGFESSQSQSNHKVPSNIFFLSKKEYTFDSCYTVLTSIKLLHNEGNSRNERDLLLHTLLNFDYKVSVFAVGALVKYLEKEWAHFIANKDDLQFFDIEQISLKNRVLVDSTTFSALQIFNQCSHEATFKRGLQWSNREGLSVFKLFSSFCKSKLGSAALRNILTNPINDGGELLKRLDFIGFVLHPARQEYVESLQDNLKHLNNLTVIISKIQNLRATTSDWNNLHKNLSHIVFIDELSAPYFSHSEFLQDFHKTVTTELVALENSINRAIDFSVTRSKTRPQIKLGLDQQLDAKKLRRSDIIKHVNAAARLAVNELPHYIQGCSIVYLPDIGHLIALQKWSEQCEPEELESLGFQFMFELNKEFYFRNPICLELDESLGNLSAEIIAHENRILQRLSTFVMRYNGHVRRSLELAAQIDAVISMAKVARQNNYTRPQLNDVNIHEVESARHPLLELVSNIKSNDFTSGGENYSNIKIITGPNGSGKSIYLKQMGLIVYLAHIGSYVPAKRANIGLMYSFHTRMQSTESASVRLSAFMIDIMQTTQALNNAKANSLILLDEFGRGTIEDEGFALLVTALNQFRVQNDNCPHVVVSTHFQKIAEYLPDDQFVEHLQMQHASENNSLLYLYKIGAGVSRSFAFEIAATIGLDENVIERARKFMNSRDIAPLELFQTDGDLLKIDLPELDQTE